MRIHFLGAAKQITGTCFLVEGGGKKMLVDCGFFQGDEAARRKNYEEFAFDPSSIDFVFLTHAHADHIGRVPQLVKQGFKGTIFATEPTADFFPYMLEDSVGHFQEESKKLGKDPPYTKKDIKAAELLVRRVHYREKISIDKTVAVRFQDAGHILGSAIIELFITEKGKEQTVIFSGDLGNAYSPILPPPAKIKKADIIIVESTYGGQFHDDPEKRRDMLEDVVEEVARKNGVLLIPAFSLERIQLLLYELHTLIDEKKVYPIPVFIDSPLAIRLLDVYKKFKGYLRLESLHEFGGAHGMFEFPGVKLTKSIQDSKRIIGEPTPKIIIAGSGMSMGGRIVYHEKEYLPNPSNIILLVNHQGKVTKGDEILKGAKDVTLLGERVAVRAQVRTIFGYSAHGDQSDLSRWLSGFERFSSGPKGEERLLKKIFVVHGEEESSQALAVWARDNLGVEVEVPEMGEVAEI